MIELILSGSILNIEIDSLDELLSNKLLINEKDEFVEKSDIENQKDKDG